MPDKPVANKFVGNFSDFVVTDDGKHYNPVIFPPLEGENEADAAARAALAAIRNPHATEAQVLAILRVMESYDEISHGEDAKLLLPEYVARFGRLIDI